MTEVDLTAQEVQQTAEELGLPREKNVYDFFYQWGTRADFPEVVQRAAHPGCSWVLLPLGSGAYRLLLIDAPSAVIEPRVGLATTKIPDSTPGLIAAYAQTDEQALLAKVRYNRLIDIFTGVTCYSLQNHLKSTARLFDDGKAVQVEIDELYVGVNKRGTHYAFPVEAKGGTDRLGLASVITNCRLCREKYPDLEVLPLAVQFAAEDVIVVFAFEWATGSSWPRLAEEKHYQLVPYSAIGAEDLARYRNRLPE